MLDGVLRVRSALNLDMQHEEEPGKPKKGCPWHKRQWARVLEWHSGDLSGALRDHLPYSFSFLFGKKSFLRALSGNFTGFYKDLSEMKRWLSK